MFGYVSLVNKMDTNYKGFCPKCMTFSEFYLFSSQSKHVVGDRRSLTCRNCNDTLEEDVVVRFDKEVKRWMAQSLDSTTLDFIQQILKTHYGASTISRLAETRS